MGIRRTFARQFLRVATHHRNLSDPRDQCEKSDKALCRLSYANRSWRRGFEPRTTPTREEGTLILRFWDQAYSVLKLRLPS